MVHFIRQKLMFITVNIVEVKCIHTQVVAFVRRKRVVTTSDYC